MSLQPRRICSAVEHHQSAVWVSYDNLKSIQKKLDFLLEKKLGGSMVWSVDLAVR